MSVFLITSSLVTTLLIPAAAFQTGGRRQRTGAGLSGPPSARRGLRHPLRHFDHPDPVVRGRVGDGRPAEHRAALPAPLRHGPRLGARHPPAGAGLHGHRPVVTLAFRANVDAQAGAYATGVLALMTSAAVAVTLSAFRHQQRGLGYFALISPIFIYTMRVHRHQQPRGPVHRPAVHSWRCWRSASPRGCSARSNCGSAAWCSTTRPPCCSSRFRFARCGLWRTTPAGLPGRVPQKELRARQMAHLPDDRPFLFLEVEIDDASEFSDVVEVTGASSVRTGCCGPKDRACPTPSPR